MDERKKHIVPVSGSGVRIRETYHNPREFRQEGTCATNYQ